MIVSLPNKTTKLIIGKYENIKVPLFLALSTIISNPTKIFKTVMLFLALSTIIYPPSKHLPGSTESKEGMYHTLQAFIMSVDCSLASL